MENEDLLQDYEPLTERLRGLPLDAWSKADFEQEETARRTLAADCFQKADTSKWMIETFRPLHEKFPNAPLAELIPLLPEPERSIAFDIVHAPVNWRDLPIQQANRESWHDRLEQTIITRTMANWNFTTDDLLDEAKIPDRARRRARKYAEEILFAAEGRRIQV